MLLEFGGPRGSESLGLREYVGHGRQEGRKKVEGERDRRRRKRKRRGGKEKRREGGGKVEGKRKKRRKKKWKEREKKRRKKKMILFSVSPPAGGGCLRSSAAGSGRRTKCGVGVLRLRRVPRRTLGGGRCAAPGARGFNLGSLFGLSLWER